MLRSFDICQIQYPTTMVQDSIVQRDTIDTRPARTSLCLLQNLLIAEGLQHTLPPLHIYWSCVCVWLLPPSAATSGFSSRNSHSSLFDSSTAEPTSPLLLSSTLQRFAYNYPYADARFLEDSRTRIITLKFHFQLLTFPHNFCDIS